MPSLLGVAIIKGSRGAYLPGKGRVFRGIKRSIMLFLALTMIAVTTMSAAAIPTGGVSYYELFTTTDSWNGYTLTNSGASSVASYPSFAISGNGAVSSANFVNAESDYMYRNSVVSGFPFSVNAWFRASSVTVGYLWMLGDSGGNNDYFAILHDGDHISVIRKTASSADIQDFTNTTYSTGTWYMVTAVFSSATDTKYYLDGKTIGLDTDSRTFPASTDIFCLGVLCRLGIGSYFDGYIDEVSVYTKALSYVEIQNLYDYGDSDYGANTPPSITPYTPINNYHTNLTNNTFIANITDEDGDDVNCSLVVNGVVEQAINDYAGGNKTFWATLTAGTKTWFINCTDGTDTNTTSNRTLIIDTTNPVYTGVTPQNDNSTVIDKKDGDNVVFGGYWTDTYMFAWNRTINYPNGTLLYTDNDTGLVGSKEWVNATLNVSAWPNGEYAYVNYGSDDHTAKEIPDYEVTMRSDSITYDTGSAEITITSLFETTNIETTKETDRYTWTYNTLGEKGKLSFTLESNQKIFYRGTLRPYASFVTGDNWVDFNIRGADVKYTVQRKSDYEYELELEVEEADEFTFDSIGGLNTAGIRISFNVTATSDLVVSAKNIVTNNAINVFNLTLANGTTRTTTTGSVTFTGLTPANYSYTLRAYGYDDLATYTDTITPAVHTVTKYMTEESGSTTTSGEIKEGVLIMIGMTLFLLFMLFVWFVHRNEMKGDGLSYITAFLIAFVGAMALYFIELSHTFSTTVKTALLLLYVATFLYITFTAVKSNNA